MFGTLVLSLPSYHQGGDVILRHAGRKMVYDSSTDSVSWATWYSYMRHEIRPVEKGTRWVLTFNLCTQPITNRLAGHTTVQSLARKQQPVRIGSRVDR